MPLRSGTRLGVYEIVAPVGAGGMGEVYRARDSKLRRDVALKILPASVADSPDRLARFRREALVLASLNHPNIAQIYGVEDGDLHALVLEFVEGPTLAGRIASGPIPVTEALGTARQIAEALEAAHAMGIIHRDLKPSNIKVRPDTTVKVLDFGLARAVAPVPGSSDTTANAADPELTTPGSVIGTAAYMSPEQAAGHAADARSDIWAFGAVLFEMLTGRRTFDGPSVAHVLAAVMKGEPEWTALPVDTPPSIRRLLRRCLEKDRQRRMADIHDVRLEIDDALAAAPSDGAGATTPIDRHGSRVEWSLVAVLAFALGAAIVFWAPWRRPQPMDPRLMRLNVDLGPEAVGGPNLDFAIAPDASRIAFPARSPDGKVLLATRLLSDAQLVFLPGTEGARSPFFSPDGQWVGFLAAGQIRKVAIQGGAVVTLCDISNVLGASWGEDQQIVFGPGVIGPLVRVSAGGGPAKPITKTGVRGDATHRWPQVLAGGRDVLFTAHKIVTGFDDASIDVVTVATGARKTVVHGGYAGRVVESPDGAAYLLYVHNGTLFASSFDLQALETRGSAAPILGDVAGNADMGAGQYDVSRTGTLVYHSGKGPARVWPLIWVDSTGKSQTLLAEPGAYYTPSLSPDGSRVAMTIDRGDKGREIAVYDWRRGAMTQLTFTGEVNLFPVWSPDGRYIVFESSSPNGYGIGLVRSDGAGGIIRLAENAGLMIPTAFSPDGRTLAYQSTAATGLLTLSLVPFDASDPAHPRLGAARPVDDARFAEGSGTFAPDGAWMAYHSYESGRVEVHVRRIAGGSRTVVSTAGGSAPIWDPSGRRLFFRTPDGRIMVVDYVIKGDAFVASAPRPWGATVIGSTPFNRDYTIAPDGQRFVVIPRRDPEPPTGSVHLMFVINVVDQIRAALGGPRS